MVRIFLLLPPPPGNKKITMLWGMADILWLPLMLQQGFMVCRLVLYMWFVITRWCVLVGKPGFPSSLEGGAQHALDMWCSLSLGQ